MEAHCDHLAAPGSKLRLKVHFKIGRVRSRLDSGAAPSQVIRCQHFIPRKARQ